MVVGAAPRASRLYGTSPKGGGMNQNSWHKRLGCTPGNCKYNSHQCEECGTCFSPMDPPIGRHDDLCETGFRSDQSFREELQDVAIKLRMKRVSVDNGFEE